MKVGEYLTNASYQLNDQAIGREFTRWTRAQLLSHLNGALAEINTYKPEVFTSQVDLSLVEGSRQTVSAGVNLVSINANSNGKFVREADLDLLRAYAPHDCCAVSAVFDVQGNPVYTAKSYAIDPKEPRTFYVSPPVPTGITTATMKATVNAAPVYTLSDLAVDLPLVAKYQENILDYIIGRAQLIDTESQQSFAMGNKRLGLFYNALGVKYRVESAYRAGNYNGTVGDGDPRARV